jgi:FKBP-type peptidyl-prolyl cis-trans isomerase FkpA
VQLTDTVVVHYKGWLFSNGSVFDETKEKQATFPLARLIRGWQIGVPQCKVGGKIRLFIPSGSAYGIRTFATDIPPNSTLVFDVEVVEVKERI